MFIALAKFEDALTPRHDISLGFSFLLLKPQGCIQFVKQRRQVVYLDSMIHRVNTNGYNTSTTEMGFSGFC